LEVKGGDRDDDDDDDDGDDDGVVIGVSGLAVAVGEL
jgi:hypothetical protein